jgi:hypothetical protein
MTLIEDELYMYNNKSDEQYNKMYIISGSYVQQKNPKEEVLVQSVLTKIYPIDVHLGGRIGGIKLYFDARDKQEEWITEL